MDELYRIFNADCRGVLPSIEAVDTVITDPVWPNRPDDMFPNCGDPKNLLRETLELIEARRVVVILRSDSDPRFLSAVPERWPFFRIQVLPYVMPGYIGRKLGGDEMAYCFGEPIPSSPGRRVIPGRAPKAQPQDRPKNGHPCSRALVHMAWLVDWWSLVGETILDPFMGSGTIGLAALQAGRKFVGIEVEKKYYDIAEKRLKTYQMPMMEMMI